MASITATFGTAEYREGGVIAIPLNFAEDVIVPSKSICRITRVSGSDLAGVNYRIIGKGRAFEVVVEVPPDRKGSFAVAMTGTVLNPSTHEWDTITVTASTVPYDTRIPRIVDYDIPADYTVGEKFDVILQIEPESTLSPAPAGGTFLDHFIFEGADLGTPNIYRKTDNTYPQLPIDANLPPEWVQTDLTTETATLYLLRWDPVEGNPQGVFNLTVREGAFRGPVE